MKKLQLLATIILLTFGVNSYAQSTNCLKDSTERTRIIQEDIPNSYTCFMEMTRGVSKRYGTGFLIHPRVILTAGHNLAYYPTGKVKKVKMYFGSIDSLNYEIKEEVKLKRGRNKFYKSNYFIFGNIKRDFSIIILPDSSVYKKVKGHFNIAPLTTLSTESITITGSPGDKDLFEIWTETTNNFFISENALKYDFYTEVRNSGSPIWYQKEANTYNIAGIHSRSYGTCSASVFITPEVYNKIKKWCSKAGINL
ncbi:hypothetical protein SYJ56_22485 [Algoriphagus sp. D3-2-R+10]|uniref:trypsin-like serine protease n=1 Tax=Algoriphagus aurantiacus TaxID=3103948 RepID=UPI002B3977DA|nr:trypsin-like serine protease [Algoriphagus sp. D3-2-R+10]MEB2778098.1 hypothetical protein [Algoriphagus sp. D3-2-R+10]